LIAFHFSAPSAMPPPLLLPRRRHAAIRHCRYAYYAAIIYAILPPRPPLRHYAFAAIIAERFSTLRRRRHADYFRRRAGVSLITPLRRFS
jgi:hypothetical protein